MCDYTTTAILKGKKSVAISWTIHKSTKKKEKNATFVCFRNSSYALAHTVMDCVILITTKKSVRSKCDNCHTQYYMSHMGMRHDGLFSTFHSVEFFCYQSHFNLGESCEGYPKNTVYITWYGLPFITQTLNKQERLIIHFDIWPHMHLNLNESLAVIFFSLLSLHSTLTCNMSIL